MAQVMVTIDGKAYRMACEEGQEGHLTELAEGFDRYVGHLKTQFGEIGDRADPGHGGETVRQDDGQLTVLRPLRMPLAKDPVSSYICCAVCASRQEPQSLGPYSIQGSCP